MHILFTEWQLKNGKFRTLKDIPPSLVYSADGLGNIVKGNKNCFEAKGCAPRDKGWHRKVTGS